MKLYLSSYRIGNRSEELRSWIKKHDNKILVIPNALDIYLDSKRKNDGILEKCQDLENIGFKVEILDLRNYFSNNELLREKLEEYRAFYVLGGNVFVLRQAMFLSGFDNYLKEISDKKDYLYAGFSAGVCVLASDLHGFELVDDQSEDPYNYGKTIWTGIGLIDYNIVPHFDTPSHPESPLMYSLVSYLQKENKKYKTLKDGEVIIEDITYNKII